MPWWIYSVVGVFVLFSSIGLLTADTLPVRIRRNEGKKSSLDTSNIKFDFEPGSGAGLTDTDDEDLVGSGSGLSGSGDGVIFDTDQKPTPTTASTTTVNITTTSRPKSICEKAYQTNKLGILHYMPKCLPNGDYAALQCYGQQGSSNCFCSDHSGKEIPGTLMEPPNYPECDNGENLNPCVFQVVKFFRSKLMGTFYPKCTREGQFEKIQCHENLCYCVNPESGEKILGTEAHFPVDHKHCEVDTGMGTSQKTSTSPEPEVKIPETNLDPDNEDSSPTDNDDEGDTIDNDNPIIIDENVQDKTTKEVDDKMDTVNVNVNSQQPNSNENDVSQEENKLNSNKEVISKKPDSENQVKTASSEIMTQPGILAGIIGGSVVVLLCLVLLIMFVVYRMRKKDEGSYPLDEPRKAPNYSYVRAPEKEFYA